MPIANYNFTKDPVELPFITTDVDLKIRSFNEKALSVLGHSISEYINKSAIEYFINFHKTDLTDSIKLAKKTHDPVGLSINSDYLNRKIRGAIFKCDTHFAIILREVTDEIDQIVNLTDSQHQLKAVLDSSDNGIVLLTPDFKVMAFNKTAQKLKSTNLNKEMVIGASFSDYLGQHDNKNFNDAFKNALNGEYFSGDVDILFQNQTYYFRIHMNPVTSNKGEIIGVALAYSDITDVRLKELDNLRIINNLIERNKNLEQFNYIISHNTRSSLITLSELTKLLQSNLTQAELNFVYKGIEDSAKKLDNTIKDVEDVLNTSRSVNESKTEINLMEMLKEVKDMIGTSLTKEKVVFNVDFDAVPVIKTVKPYIHSIFYNLITNSLKYQKENTTPEVTIRTERAGANVVLYFKDNGIGIDLEKNRTKLFGLYNRFNFNTEGKGMGLFMVKTQVNALGGTIDVDSKLGEGTEFKITSPIN